MRVVAETKDGLLLSATESDLAALLGYYASEPVYIDLRKKLRPGAELNPYVIWRFLQTLQAREKEVRNNAATLRALADLIEQQLPTNVITPAPEENLP